MAVSASCTSGHNAHNQHAFPSHNGGGHIKSQLTRSLDRILDEASASGELKLSGRKLKDFPNTGKYQLDDTVLADLSKNRFGEVPDEVTAFYFMEKLLLCHNAIRSIPDNIGMLQSLIYIDLSHNQLTEIPRDICQLPLQVLLLSNNRLTSIPKEIGKMSLLAELDASNNQINQLPMTIGDLPNLRALNLKNNQLGLLPLQITYLQLEILDISCNCISSLPLELRHMTSLVNLKLEHNPLVFPPATVCVRGRIHIFKYLENQANKDNIQKRGDDTRRSVKQINHNHLPYNASHQSPSTFVVDGLRHKVRYNVDSGYSTSDSGEKRWSSDGIGMEENNSVPLIGVQGSGRSTPSTPSTISPGPAHLSRAQSLSTETPPTTPTLGCRISPDGNIPNGDDKNKSVSHQQTYRQYKEALRQQRQQDVYRPRNEQTSPPSTTPTSTNHSYSTPHSPVANGYHHRNIVSSNPSLATQNSPTNTISSNHSTPKKYFSPTNNLYQSSGSYNSTENATHNSNNSPLKNDDIVCRKPVQKVVPSRNTNKTYSPTGIPVSNSNNSISPSLTNGNISSDHNGSRLTENRNYNSPSEGNYIKPVSPIKGSSSFMSHNNIPTSKSNSLGRNYKTSPTDTTDQSNGSPKLLTTTVGFVNNSTPPIGTNTNRINWNKDLPPDKLSFTMKREFDKAKEESELIEQLRNIIENRLKMTLPRDLAPVLADGVVLCHLANHVCPRSVASVHVPSATQPKLTMARCRRNVDNFLEACRKIGVEEDAVCQPHDILSLEQDENTYEKLAVIFKTVNALLMHRPTPAHATENYENYLQDDIAAAVNENYKENDKFNQYTTDNNENCYDKDASDRYNYQNYRNTLQNKSVHRSRYAEDRCISNFNMFADDPYEADEILCITANVQNNNDRHDPPKINGIADKNQNKDVIYYSHTNMENKINVVIPLLNENHKTISTKTQDNQNFDILSSQTVKVSDRINYFNSKKTTMNLDIKNNLNSIQNKNVEDVVQTEFVEDDKFMTWFCIGIFLSTLILLYLFPLPN